MAYVVQTAKKLKQFFVEIGELSYFAMRFLKKYLSHHGSLKNFYGNASIWAIDPSC